MKTDNKKDEAVCCDDEKQTCEACEFEDSIKVDTDE
jgi:hypothetical protein